MGFIILIDFSTNNAVLTGAYTDFVINAGAATITNYTKMF